MSRINRIRIVNLNYNNHAIRIDDELFELANENTLLSLRNGGGKSVLIQMLTAPFVNKRYRNTADRPFASYFTTNKPTFILVEWALDHDAGYVLTGMMVRQSQEQSEDEKTELEIIQFIHEYQASNDYDIEYLPIIEKTATKKTLTGFQACKNLFERCKQDRALKFDYYDMNQQPRSKAYFQKLEEYQIYAKEWETIIKKINEKESGLSDLFKEAKDEKGLVEKWFLNTVEKKLDKDQNQVKAFEQIVRKYVEQYKANQQKFQERDGIFEFRALLAPLREQIEQLATIETQIVASEQEIQQLFQILTLLVAEFEQKQQQFNQEQIALQTQQYQLNYEQQSMALHEQHDQLSALQHAVDSAQQQIAHLNEKKLQKQRQLAIYIAARLHDTYQGASADVQRLEHELAIAQQENSELLPIQANLGYNLANRYELQKQREEQVRDDVLEAIHTNKAEQRASEQILADIELQQRNDLEQQGYLLSEIKQFDQVEQRFNHAYQAQLQRNLEKMYEPLSLEVLSEQITNQRAEQERNMKQCYEAQETISLQLREQDRLLDDTNQIVGELKVKTANASNDRQKLEAEREIRLPLLSYISFDSQRVLEKSAILQAFEQKKQRVSERLQAEQRSYEQVETLYEKLASGTVIELPETIEQAFQDIGIQPILGMTWLQRNGQTAAEKQQLVQQQPFLPYSIILTQTDFLKLQQSQLETFTTFPIPIIIREQLGTVNLAKNGVYTQAGEMQFYVLFNDQLLDEEQLQTILQAKQLELEVIEKRIVQYQTEYEFYDEKITLIAFQELTVQAYQQAITTEAQLLEATKQHEEQLLTLQTQKKNFTIKQENIQARMMTCSQLLNALTNKQQACNKLCEDYQLYLQSLEKQQAIAKQIEAREQQQKHARLQYEQLKDTYEILKDEDRSLQEKIATTKKHYQKFSHYRQGSHIQTDIEDLLAEYEAITNKMSLSLTRSEADLTSAKERFSRAEAELTTHTKREQLVDSDYKMVVPNLAHEDKLRNEYESIQATISQENMTVTNIQNEKIRVETRIQADMERLARELHQTIVLPKTEIVNRNFTELFAQLTRSQQENEQNRTRNNATVEMLKREAATLVEYASESRNQQPLLISDEMRATTEQEWREKRTTLLRDYKHQVNSQTESKLKITDSCNQIARQATIQQVLFQQPFKQLSLLKHQPTDFFAQYAIIDQAFTSLLEKVAIDIQISEKEKANVIELLLDYVGAIHQQLDTIDNNSTITVRDKNIKMLRIILPDWEQNISTSHIKMADFLASITNQCLEIYAINGNVEEFIGSQITTKNLYDTIIGTANVQIKLFKIEEQREYQITWQQVAKNSGGEGFLSAFVILSSLLAFMRSDASNLLTKNQQIGKVLLMDNPFAQTNAAHLLKPLIELAKRNKTQLICLSGLGGDSIYNRFENIYSLALVPSHFNKGCEYMKSEHVKGELPHQQVIPSRVYVQEHVQDQLLF
ncbi:MAG: hypothetical protein ACRC17_08150 [Culicoidibacterales bacterium]